MNNICKSIFIKRLLLYGALKQSANSVFGENHAPRTYMSLCRAVYLEPDFATPGGSIVARLPREKIYTIFVGVYIDGL